MKKTIRQLTLFKLACSETVATVTTDKEITFHKTPISAKKVKSDFDISDNNLIVQLEELSEAADVGQWCVVNGKVYLRTME